VWFEKFSISISGISFHQYYSNHSVFIRRIKSVIVILVVYADDVLLTDSDPEGLLETKEYLKHHFVTKDMGCLNTF